MPETQAPDLLFRPVDELAGLIRDGELSARELVQASLDRIDELNPRLNAFVDVFADEALAAADAVGPGDRRPFAGVPIAIKNNRAVEGKRLTFAADFFGDFLAPYDHNVARRLREAGFIVVGTTTLPEYGILPVTETRRFGPTRNPWDPERTPGGSSGGSAAAVAAGMVPIAHANDGGGSIRIPAACCGLVGLKPQRGRVSLAPEVGGSFLVADGVRDAAPCARRPRCSTSWPVPSWATLLGARARRAVRARAAERAPSGLRIAMTTAAPLEDAEVDPSASAPCTTRPTCSAGSGTRSSRTRRRGPPRGCSSSSRPPSGRRSARRSPLGRCSPAASPTADDMEPLSWAIWELCRGITSTQALAAEMQLMGFARAMVTWAAQYDAVLTPALAEAPVTLGTIDPLSADPHGGVQALRDASRRSPRRATSPARPRSPCRCTSGRTATPPRASRSASSSSASPRARARCSPWPPSSRRRRPGPTAGRRSPRAVAAAHLALPEPLHLEATAPPVWLWRADRLGATADRPL